MPNPPGGVQAPPRSLPLQPPPSGQPPAFLPDRGQLLAISVGSLGVQSAFDSAFDTEGDKVQGVLSPEQTWMQYAVRLVYSETRGRLARHKLLSGSLVETKPVVDAAGDAGPIRSATAAGPIGSATTTVPDLLQEVAGPSAQVRLQFQAARIGYPIPASRLLVVEGTVAKLDRTTYLDQSDAGRWGNLRIHRMVREDLYYLTQPPAGALPDLASLIDCLDGSA